MTTLRQLQSTQTYFDTERIVQGTERHVWEALFRLFSHSDGDLMCNYFYWNWHIPNVTKNVFMNVWILSEVLSLTMIKYLLTLLGLTNLGKALLWGNVKCTSQNVEQHVKAFNCTCVKILNAFAPPRKKHAKPKSVPWLKDDIRNVNGRMLSNEIILSKF